MGKLGVPCPQCGSIRVIVGIRPEDPTASESRGVGGKSHVARLHRCSCENCRHAFQHDFAFSEILGG